MPDERRRSERHNTKGGALAVLSIPGQFELKLGQIADISPGGLSLIYTGSGEPPGETAAVPAEVELLGHEDMHLGLKGIPCRIVYDSLLAIDPETALETRRCGVEFIRPTNKLARLEYFIRSNQ